ncbi:MAG: hypothetical protein CMJ14_03595 [Pelagibacterales bacterium]|nr:hypothetical protein [Pelagibacterales bacterium]|tara:strand:+ start:8250 stop:8756 length:507 start_codon:yes stop_codon:yes gene_type:complete
MSRFLFKLIFIYFGFQTCFADESHIELGNYGNWDAYYWNLNDGKVCVMMSVPLKEEGKYTRRGDVYAQVSLNENNSNSGVVSFQAGYTYKIKSEINVIIDKNNKMLLQPVGRVAWTVSEEEDSKLIKFMKLGNEMIVRGISSRGTNTKDTYSLKGFSAAYKAIKKVCN